MRNQFHIIPVMLFLLGTGMVLAQQQHQIQLGYFVNGEIGQYRYQTVIVVQNQETTEAQLQIRFRNENGQSMQGLTLRARAQNGHQHQVGQNGSVQGLGVPPGAFRAFESSGTGPLVVGSCSLESGAGIRAYSRINLFDGQGNLLNEVNILPSGNFRSAGFLVGKMDPADIGIALTNTNQTSTATCVLQLYETVDGAENDLPLLEGDGVVLSLGGGAQTTKMLMQLFEEQYEETLKDFLADPETGDVYAVVTCDNPVCAVLLHLNGLEMLGIPVNPTNVDE